MRRPGHLRDRVTFQTVTEARDATYRGPEQTATTLGSRWAHVEALGGQERFEAQQSYGEVDHRITVRYDATLFAALGSEDRVVYDSRTFDIVAVLEAKRREWIEVLAKERR